MRTYRQSLEFLFSLRGVGVKLGLERIRAFTEALGRPQDDYRSIIVGGTNGKGSVVSMLDSILRASGYRVGRVLSPHIADFGERIAVDGEPVDREFLVEFLERWDSFILEEGVSFFETVTALALEYFREKQVDTAILEVGMGGRLDASNIVDADLALVTSIGLDHTKSLGSTLGEIAAEKIRISRPGKILAAGCLEPAERAYFKRYGAARDIRTVLLGEDASVAVSSPGAKGVVFDYTGLTGMEKRYEAGLHGSHQAVNGATALMALEAAADLFPVSETAARDGLRETFIPGRLQVVQENPPVIIDVSHNPAGTAALADSLDRIYPGTDFCVLFGAKADKDYRSMVASLSGVGSSLLAVRPPVASPRDPTDIAEAARPCFRTVEIVPDLAAGVNRFYEVPCGNRTGGLLVTGSFFTVSAAIEPLIARGCSLDGLHPGEDLHRMAV